MPSIVYGILGLALFVRTLALGRTVVSAALTLALLILPVVIIASIEALKAVPQAQREGAYALGATRWQMVRRSVLPAAAPGIMTGIILAMARAIGARPRVMDPIAHDRLMAYLSHLPQLTVSALMQVVGERAGEDGLGLAGTGLRDTTRRA